MFFAVAFFLVAVGENSSFAMTALQYDPLDVELLWQPDACLVGDHFSTVSLGHVYRQLNIPASVFDTVEMVKSNELKISKLRKNIDADTVYGRGPLQEKIVCLTEQSIQDVMHMKQRCCDTDVQYNELDDQPCRVSSRISMPEENQFTLAQEIRALCDEKSINHTMSRSLSLLMSQNAEEPVSVEITRHNAPKLYTLIASLVQTYPGLVMPEINLIEGINCTEKSTYDEQGRHVTRVLKLGAALIAHVLTDREIKHVIAHEFAHCYRKHTKKLRELDALVLSRPEYDAISWVMGRPFFEDEADALERAYETEADILALIRTHDTAAFISSTIKLYLWSLNLYIKRMDLLKLELQELHLLKNLNTDFKDFALDLAANGHLRDVQELDREILQIEAQVNRMSTLIGKSLAQGGEKTHPTPHERICIGLAYAIKQQEAVN